MRIARLPVALATAFALVALPGAAAAVEYTKMEPAGSKVVSFDPAKPQTGKASLDVELGSVDAGSPDADSEVVTAPWFNVEKFPKAHFESTSITAKGGDSYEIAGKLTIKGTTKDVSFPATFKADGNKGTFSGSLSIKRGDFSIGEGDWASTDIVAGDVTIRFDLNVAAQ